ncbi:MAG TPA: transposase [Mesorhizobium sp.]|jgi:hypothetical protein|uniref:transposase n=1 Tax=Mesorhizobium sp. TaxID=1871066 RepID=UPI002DDD6B33|nr:transposase [Mesorhizobium sp.]HEV2501791.1 transposase [Mesorhizobium sp.]
MTGDPLERLNTVVAWEMFRKPLAKALNFPGRAQGGRPPYDAVMKLEILVLQALSGLSDEQAEFQITDRRTFGRFFGLVDVGDRVDAGFWPPPTPAPKSGPTRHIGRTDQASSAACIARSQEAGRCRRISSTATGHATGPAPVSSIPSPSRRTGWDHSSALSAGRARAKVEIGMVWWQGRSVTDAPFEVGAEMRDDRFQSRPGPRLAALISVHKTCLAKLRDGTVSAYENEWKSRSHIVAYEPRNDGEALKRLSYLFAMVATANDWLEDDEVEEFLTMVRNY